MRAQERASGLGSKKPGMPPSTVDQYDVASLKPGQHPRARQKLLALASGARIPASLRQPVLGLVAGDQARIDGADRRADDPIRLDAGLVQGLIDAGLIGAERTAALEDEDDLAGKIWFD